MQTYYVQAMVAADAGLYFEAPDFDSAYDAAEVRIAQRCEGPFVIQAGEHSSHGVQNVLGAINIVLASGRIGRESCGLATITGQANGQGGREHGQECDQLPGMRDISKP